MVSDGMCEVSIIVPARWEGNSLLTTIEAIQDARRMISVSSEVIIALSRGDADTEISVDKLVTKEGIRSIDVIGSGKFNALSAAVAAASGNIMVFIDADVLPEKSAFQALLKPLHENRADVSAGRPIASTFPSKSYAQKILKDWGSISMTVWHMVRMSHPELLWALSGYLFAMRREFFPSAPIVPVLDDASIGLWAKDQSARFEYVEQAKVAILTPSSYRDWVRQKVRIRGGWESLKQLRKIEMAALTDAIDVAKAKMKNETGVTGHMLFVHDSLLRAACRAWVKCFGGDTDGKWTPIMSTKQWDAKTITLDEHRASVIDSFLE